MAAIVASHLMSSAHAAKSSTAANADTAGDAFAAMLSLLDEGTGQDAAASIDGDTKLAANDGSKSIDPLLKSSDTTPDTSTVSAPTQKNGTAIVQPIVHWRAAEIDAEKATNDNDGRTRTAHTHPALKGDVTDADTAKVASGTPPSDTLRFGAPVDPSALKPSEDVKPGKKSDDSKTNDQHSTLRASEDSPDTATNVALMLQTPQPAPVKPATTGSDAVIRSGEDVAPAAATPSAPVTPALPATPQLTADDAQDDDVAATPPPTALKPAPAKPSDKDLPKAQTSGDANNALQELSEAQIATDPKQPPAASGDTKAPTPAAAHTPFHATPAADAPATPAQNAQTQAVQNQPAQNQPAQNQSTPQPGHTDGNAAAAVSAPAAAAPVAAPQAQLQLHAQLQASNADASPNLPALAVQIATHSDDGQKHFNIRLDPPELGRVDVHLTVDDTGKAQATLSVDKPQTLALLQKDAPELQRQLKDAGLDLSQNGLNFSLRQQQQNAGNSNGDANGSRGRNQPIRAVATVEAPSSPSNSVSIGAADARLDIRV